jgi:hypothetical protein
MEILSEKSVLSKADRAKLWRLCERLTRWSDLRSRAITVQPLRGGHGAVRSGIIATVQGSPPPITLVFDSQMRELYFISGSKAGRLRLGVESVRRILEKINPSELVTISYHCKEEGQ